MTPEKNNNPTPVEKKQQKNKVETPEQKTGKEYKEITSRYEKEYTKLNNKDQKKGVWIQYNKEGSVFTKGKYGSELFIKEVQNYKDNNDKNDIYTETGLHYDGKNFYLVMYHGTGSGDNLKTTEKIGEWAKPKKISHE